MTGFVVDAPTDLHPDLLAALRPFKATIEPKDWWTCRKCGAGTHLVIVVPYDGAWKHAVEPLCNDHYPDRPMLCTYGWPGPATKPKYARDREHRALTITRVLALLRQAEHRMVHGGCNVPGYTGGHTVFFPDDVWPDLIQILEEVKRA